MDSQADGATPSPSTGTPTGPSGASAAACSSTCRGVVTRGQEVVVSYTDPTPGDDDVALQDLAGNDMASFTETATNNSAVEPVPALPLAGLGLLGVLLVLLGRRRQGG